MTSQSAPRSSRWKYSALVAPFVAVMATAATMPVGAQTPDRDDAAQQWEQPAPIVITVDGERTPSPEEEAEIRAQFEQPGPRARGAVAAASTVGQFQFDFVTDVPPEVQTAAEAAAQAWNDALQPDGPIVVQFAWSPPSRPGVLGSAGPGFLGIVTLAGGNVRLPGAVLNHQTQSDVAPELSEIRVTISSSINQNLTWCFAVDGSDCTPSTISLYDTILHELGHGLGFLGSAFETEQGLVFATDGVPFIYDTHVYVGQGPGAPRLLSLPNPLPPLTGNNLFFRSLTDQFYAVHAPTIFRSGSSFSHIDEATFGEALMTPSAANGQFIGAIDGLTLDIMRAAGWSGSLVDGRTRPPLAVSQPGVRLLDTACSDTLLSGGGVTAEASVVFGLPDGCPVPNEADAVLVTLWTHDPFVEGNLRIGPAGGIVSGVVNFGANGLENTTSLWVPLSSGDELELSANGGVVADGTPLAERVEIEILAWSGTSTAPDALGYHPVNPCAFFDSRPGQTPSNPGPYGTNNLVADVTGAFPAGQGGGNTDCGVPNGASAVLVNAVAIQPTGEVLLTAPDSGATLVFNEPLSGAFNNASAVTLPVDENGNVKIDLDAVGAATAHVRLQVLGYFGDIADPGSLVFNPVDPCVVFDSRPGRGATDSNLGERTGGQTTTYDVVGDFPAGQGGGNSSCNIPASAQAVEINVVAVNALAPGNLRATAAGVEPAGGVLNFGALTPKMNNANAIVVPVSASGELAITVNAGPTGDGDPITHLRGTVTGYWTPIPG